MRWFSASLGLVCLLTGGLARAQAPAPQLASPELPALAPPATAQVPAVAAPHGLRSVSPQHTYERLIAVVPLVGKGTLDDPKRPLFAPAPGARDPKGILAYHFVPTDDGRLAIVEFLASDRAAFAALRTDLVNVTQQFEKGKASARAIETALKLLRKDFQLDQFVMGAK